MTEARAREGYCLRPALLSCFLGTPWCLGLRAKCATTKAHLMCIMCQPATVCRVTSSDRGLASDAGFGTPGPQRRRSQFALVNAWKQWGRSGRSPVHGSRHRRRPQVHEQRTDRSVCVSSAGSPVIVRTRGPCTRSSPYRDPPPFSVDLPRLPARAPAQVQGANTEQLCCLVPKLLSPTHDS